MTDAVRALRELLVSGAQTLDLQLTESQIDQLLSYVALIAKWNRVYNLTAVRSAGQIVTHHVLDSLTLVPPLQRHLAGRGARLLDVGSGAGLPGVVIAICCSAIEVTCVDAVAKKAAFVQQTGSTLHLSNLCSVHARVETLTTPQDVIVSRAFASLPAFVQLTKPALKADTGIWIAMKGRQPSAEISALPSDINVFHVEQIQVAHLHAERCLVWMRPAPDQRK